MVLLCDLITYFEVIYFEFQRSEYSVAVTSATTRTFSNFANNKRAMSYQGLNANGIHRVHKSQNRDHSVDLG